MRAEVLLVLVACGGTPARPAGPTLPQGTQRVAALGSDVVIDIRGSGPVCIAHPGGPGLDSRYLQNAALEKRLTMVYIDPLGTGTSGKLPATELYSREHDVQVIEIVRNKLGLDKVCVVGHSYGGFVVLEYAIAHPEHVSGLFLYSTGPVIDEAFGKDIEANMLWFKSEPWFADAVKAFGEEDASYSDKAAPMDDAALNAIIKRELPLYFADWSGKKAQYEAVAGHFRISSDVAHRRPKGKADAYDVRRRLGVLHTTPAVIVAGEKDFILGVKPSTALASEIAGSQLIVIKNAGHLSHVEQPDAFAEAVGAFADKLH